MGSQTDFSLFDMKKTTRTRGKTIVGRTRRMQKSKLLISGLIAGSTIWAASTANAALVDLTTAGSATINGAIFQTPGPDVTSGSGTINPFLRIQHKGNNEFEQGYNTDRNNSGFQFDEVAGGHTTSIVLGDIFDSVLGVTFLLDINETASKPEESKITLQDVRLYATNDPDINGTNFNTTTGFGAAASELYRLGTGNAIVLDYNLLGQGSGRPDMSFTLAPSFFANLASTSNIVLYSAFGRKPPSIEGEAADAGFEEWAYLSNTGPGITTPLPAAAWMLLAGIGGLFGMRRYQRSS